MIHVVLGFIFDAQGKVLIAKRPQGKMFGGLWEFPGGKVEEGESIEDAIARELFEELNIKVAVNKIYQSYSYEDNGLNGLFYPVLCEVVEGQLQALEHQKLLYVNIGKMDCHDFAPPDYEAIELLKKESGQ